jgi:hypothetical protein
MRFSCVNAVSRAAVPKGLRVEDSNKNAVALFRLTHSYFGSLHIMPRKRLGKRLPEKQTVVSATRADARMRGGWRQFGETEKWFEAPMNDDVDLCGAEVFIL